tara:strand:+ start:647 stop:865 length:219 start_codon:yes stop_codon:yes gene_type:complete
MTTTPKKSNNNNSPKRLPVSPGFAKRVVNTMSSPFKKTLKNAFNTAFASPTKSQRAKSVNSGLSEFLTPTKK